MLVRRINADDSGGEDGIDGIGMVIRMVALAIIVRTDPDTETHWTIRGNLQ